MLKYAMLENAVEIFNRRSIFLIVFFFEACKNIILGTHLGVPVHVFGTETHMTAIVGMALGKSPIPEHPPNHPGHTATFLLANASAHTAVSSYSTYVHVLSNEEFRFLPELTFIFFRISNMAIFDLPILQSH